jgi:hypothetical protein
VLGSIDTNTIEGFSEGEGDGTLLRSDVRLLLGDIDGEADGGTEFSLLRSSDDNTAGFSEGERDGILLRSDAGLLLGNTDGDK